MSWDIFADSMPELLTAAVGTLRMTALDITHRPSSETATTPASFRSAISVNASPFWPTVTAPMG